MGFILAAAALAAFTIGLKFKVPTIIAASAVFAAGVVAIGLYLSLSSATIVWSTLLIIIVAQVGYFFGLTVAVYLHRNSSHR